MVLKSLLKILIIIIAIYLSVSILLFFISPPKYKYKTSNLLLQTSMVLIKPIQEISMYGKDSNVVNWEDYDIQKIPAYVESLELRSDKDQYRGYKEWRVQNLIADFGIIEKTAIVTPVDYNDYWSLIYCFPKDDYCQRSNLFYKGSIRIGIDGNTKVYGITSSDDFLVLKLDKYSKVNKDRNIPFI